MKILITANKMWNIVNFRKDLVNHLLKLGYEIHIVAPFDGHEKELSNLGCKVTSLHMRTNSINPFHAAFCIFQFFKIINSIRPNIILSFTIMNNIFCGIPARITKTHFIPNVTGLGTAFLSGQILAKITQKLYKIALKRTKTVFFQNPADQALFNKLQIVTQEQSKLLPGSGINLNDYPENPLKENQVTTILMASRIIKDKGVNEFLKASRKVKSLYPKCQFVLIGRYDERDKRSIDIHKLNRWCEDGIGQYLGFSNDVKSLVYGATLIVLPSYREGLPRIILEAAAIGRACVTTDAPGCRDIVEDGKTGLLCEVGNADSLSNKISQFLELPFSEKLKMGALARQKVEHEYSVDLVITKYVESIDQLK